MLRSMFSPLLVLVLCALGSSLVQAEENVDYQKIAEGARWGWLAEMADPLGCITQCGDKYDIELISTAKDRHALRISILLKGRELYSWKGHRHSVFRILEDRLYYALFHPSSSGGKIVAVDLTTGKELWTSPIQGLGPIHHSAYRNLMNLDAGGDVVTFYGNESQGRYFEIKDAQTGQTVGHRIFAKE